MYSRLLKVFNEARANQCLPPSMTKATKILLLKPGKDSLDLGSYRPISLLQAMLKYLWNIVLFLNLQSQVGNVADKALLSLDGHKAFDSIEWSYLWVIMRKFGFGAGYISWVQLLYHATRAAIREVSKISPSFDLHRGIRSGCPWSLFLFALAIEPMAALIRSNKNICGFKYGALQEKLNILLRLRLLFF